MIPAAEQHTVLNLATPAHIARLRARGIPDTPRPLDEVLHELKTDILPYRGHAEHPRWFAFIPAPASPLSFLGDALTAAANPHGGSWMQSSGASCIEAELIRWMSAQIGFPTTAGGMFVSGGSMANLTALTVARDRMLPEEERHKGIAYLSTQTHSSVAKGLRIIGFLERQIRRIPVDDQFRLHLGELRRAIAADRAAGLLPFAVIATAGTTNTGSIDPLPAIADLCATEKLWMHVDGAYGASACLSPQHRHLLAGIERADSLSWDAHKWLFQTYGCGTVLLRDASLFAASFHTYPEYLRDAAATGTAINFWDFGPELTRPIRGVKLWLTLQVMGAAAMGNAIAHGFRLAQWAEDELRQHPDWEIVSPAQMGIVNFRYAPAGYSPTELDALNQEISRRIVAEGFACVLTTELHGRRVLRICAIHPDATESDMRDTVRRLHHHAVSSLHAPPRLDPFPAGSLVDGPAITAPRS